MSDKGMKWGYTLGSMSGSYNNTSTSSESPVHSDSSTEKKVDVEQQVISVLVEHTTNLKSEYENSLNLAKDRLSVLENKCNAVENTNEKLKTYVRESRNKIIWYLLGTLFTITIGICSAYIFIDGKISSNTDSIGNAERLAQNKLDNYISESNVMFHNQSNEMGQLKSTVNSILDRKKTFEELIPKVSSNTTNIQNLKERLDKSDR